MVYALSSLLPNKEVKRKTGMSKKHSSAQYIFFQKLKPRFPLCRLENIILMPQQKKKNVPTLRM